MPEEADFAPLATSGHEGKPKVVFGALDKPLLRLGRNVLAAEVHQEAPDSSDLSFDMRLAFEPVVKEACAFLAADAARRPSAFTKQR